MCDFMIIIAIICSYALGGQFYQSQNFFLYIYTKKKETLNLFILHILYFILFSN